MLLFTLMIRPVTIDDLTRCYIILDCVVSIPALGLEANDHYILDSE